MKIVFVSNYYNHLQSAFSEAMYRQIGEGYAFIETMPIEQERVNLGWGEKNCPPFVLRSYVSEDAYNHCMEVIDDADIVITGSAPEAMIRKRVQDRKIVFRYSERPLKKKISLLQYCKRLIRLHQYNPRYANVYMLCASAYAAADFSKFGVFKNRFLKWGYFPAAQRYEDIAGLISGKKERSILWAGRLLNWKHPDAAVEVADRLKRDGYDFEMEIIGTGELEGTLAEMIRTRGLAGRVQMLGSMRPEQVRQHMEQSEIYLFTSDRNEGWGAVLNESMNSGCAVVASHASGSVPYLLHDKVNGLIYRNGDLDALYQKVKWLLNHAEERRAISRRAYETILTEWNEENATRKLLNIANHVINGGRIQDVYSSGVCSPAEILRDEWY